MIVKDLIELLETYDQTKQVFVCVYSHHQYRTRNGTRKAKLLTNPVFDVSESVRIVRTGIYDNVVVITSE